MVCPLAVYCTNASVPAVPAANALHWVFDAVMTATGAGGAHVTATLAWLEDPDPPFVLANEAVLLYVWHDWFVVVLTTWIFVLLFAATVAGDVTLWFGAEPLIDQPALLSPAI